MNPQTGRTIVVGGAVYERLLREQVIDVKQTPVQSTIKSSTKKKSKKKNVQQQASRSRSRSRKVSTKKKSISSRKKARVVRARSTVPTTTTAPTAVPTTMIAEVKLEKSSKPTDTQSSSSGMFMALEGLVASKEESIRKALDVLFSVAGKAGKDVTKYEQASDLLLAALSTTHDVRTIQEQFNISTLSETVRAAAKPVLLKLIDADFASMRFVTTFKWGGSSGITWPTTSTNSATTRARISNAAINGLQAQARSWVGELRGTLNASDVGVILKSLQTLRDTLQTLACKWVIVFRPSLTEQARRIFSAPSFMGPKRTATEQANDFFQQLIKVDPRLFRLLLSPKEMGPWLKMRVVDASRLLEEMIQNAIDTTLGLNFAMRMVVETVWKLVMAVLPGDQDNMRAQIRLVMAEALTVRSSGMLQMASNVVVIYFGVLFALEALTS